LEREFDGGRERHEGMIDRPVQDTPSPSVSRKREVGKVNSNEIFSFVALEISFRS